MKILGIFYLFLFFSISCGLESFDKFVPNEDFSIRKKQKSINYPLNPYTPTDILFVIDNSGSMSHYQESLAKEFNQFLEIITEDIALDYHIGILTSNNSESSKKSHGILISGIKGSSDGLEKNFISKEDITQNPKKYKSALLSRFLVGTSGTSTETFFSPLVHAISKENLEGANEGFFREDSHLVVFFVTDTDDQSLGNNFCEICSVEYTLQKLYELKRGNRNKVIGFGAILDKEYVHGDRKKKSSLQGIKGVCTEDRVVFQKNWGKLERFIEKTGGTYFNLCSSFSDGLRKISEKLKEHIEIFIPLKKVPYVRSIKVFVGGEEIPYGYNKGWTYDPKLVGIRIKRSSLEDYIEKREGQVDKLDDIEIDFIPANLKKVLE